MQHITSVLVVTFTYFCLVQTYSTVRPRYIATFLMWQILAACRGWRYYEVVKSSKTKQRGNSSLSEAGIHRRDGKDFTTMISLRCRGATFHKRQASEDSYDQTHQARYSHLPDNGRDNVDGRPTVQRTTSVSFVQ